MQSFSLGLHKGRKPARIKVVSLPFRKGGGDLPRLPYLRLFLIFKDER